MMSESKGVKTKVLRSVYRRLGPGTGFQKKGYIPSGAEVDIVAAYDGADIDGNDIWLLTSEGYYCWSGAFSSYEDFGNISVNPDDRKTRRIIEKAFGSEIVSGLTEQSQESPKQVILNADDYGVCEEIDAAIEESIEAGVLNSAACFVTFPNRVGNDRIDEYPGSLEKVKKLAKLRTSNSKLSIGLHFSMTAGQPISDVSDRFFTQRFEGDRWFRDIANLKAGKIVRRREALDELELEIKSQLYALGAALGNTKKIEHISCHHNIIFYIKPFYDRLLNVLGHPDFNHIAIRSPIMWSRSGLPVDKKSLLTPIAWKGVKHFGKSIYRSTWTTHDSGSLFRVMTNTTKAAELKACQKAMHKNVRFPYCFNDTFYGQPSHELLESLIGDIPPGAPVEFMLHVSKFGRLFWRNPKFPGIDLKYLDTRKKEFDVLNTKKSGQYLLKTYLEKHNVEIIAFRDLKGFTEEELASHYTIINNEHT